MFPSSSVKEKKYNQKIIFNVKLIVCQKIPNWVPFIESKLSLHIEIGKFYIIGNYVLIFTNL